MSDNIMKTQRPTGVTNRWALLYIENPWLDQGFDKALAMSL